MLAIILVVQHLIQMKLKYWFFNRLNGNWNNLYLYKARAPAPLKPDGYAKSANERSNSKVKEAWLYRLSLLGNLMPISARFVFLYLGKFYSTCFNQNCFRRHQIQSTALIHPPQQQHWADVTLRLKFTSCLHFCQVLLWVNNFFLAALSTNQTWFKKMLLLVFIAFS